jgi:large exoprotein involved in heme utilization and adhesion
LSIGDFLYLVNSEITTSVKNKTGNGGNINIAAGLAVLDQSQIIAQAQEGNGGNITINKYAGAFLASADSIVSASSQKGISGVVEINGVTPLNGALVALSSELRSAVALTANSCAARAGRPQSSLVEAGRGGLPQDPDASLPALYIAGRDIRLDPRRGAHRADVGGDPRAGARSAMRCD